MNTEILEQLNESQRVAVEYCDGARSFDGGIDIIDDVPIVLGDVVLDVDNDKCFVIHFIHLSFI